MSVQEQSRKQQKVRYQAIRHQINHVNHHERGSPQENSQLGT